MSNNLKTIGMPGGMSWESTATYYRALNEGVKSALGGLHSAKICMVSVDFDEIGKLQHTDDWDSTAVTLADAAKSIEDAGAEAVIPGSTEIALLVQQNHTSVPLYDTTAIHAEQAVLFAVSN